MAVIRQLSREPQCVPPGRFPAGESQVFGKREAPAHPDPDRPTDPLIAAFLNTSAAERIGDPHEAAQRVCADYATTLQTRQQRPHGNLWVRGAIVIGLATAVLWIWPYVVRSLW